MTNRRTGRTESIQFRVSPELKKAIEEYVDSRDETMGSFIRRLIVDKLGFEKFNDKLEELPIKGLDSPKGSRF